MKLLKRVVPFTLLFAFLLASCAKKENNVKLEPGTPTYDLAKNLSNTWSYLNPDSNKVLVSTKTFDITTGDFLESLHSNYGQYLSKLTQLNEDRLKRFVQENVEQLAQRKLLINAASDDHVQVSEAEIDSLLQARYAQTGGEERFKTMLQKNGVTLEHVKEQVRSNIAIQKYLDQTLADEIAVSEKDIEEVYQQDKTATVRHILLSTQGKSDSAKQEIYKKMEGILERARNGEDFAELAKKYSEDPGSKDKGGLYENFGRGAMVKSFEDAAFSVPPGEISDIVETSYGYHIIKVIERKKETQPLEQVSAQIKSKLEQQKKQEAFQAHMDKLKSEAQYELVVS